MKFLLSLSVLTALFSICSAHEESDDASFVEPVAFGLPDSKVTIEIKGEKRVIEANGIPNHEPGQFPNRGNPNGIVAQRVHYEVPLHPKRADHASDVQRMDFGVAVNGVKFDPGTAEYWHRDPRSGWREEAIVHGEGRLGMDANNAHVQPSGAYHYHGIPNGLIKQLGGEGKMVLIGWAADGFPIYGPWAPKVATNASSPLIKMQSSYHLKSGERPGGERAPGGKYDGLYTADFEYAEGEGTLDECNGRSGVTPEFPEGTYYYVATEEFPFLPRKFRGTPDDSFRHHPPGGGPGGPGGPAGRPNRPPPPSS